MKKALLILLVGGLVSSCTFCSKGNALEKMAQEILSRENYVIPDSVFSFFPNNSAKYDSFEIGSIAENVVRQDRDTSRLWNFNVTKLIEVYTCSDLVVMQSLKNEYRSSGLSSARSEDNNYFIMASESDLSKEYDLSQLKDRYLIGKDEPLVPYFKETFRRLPFLCDTTTTCGLPIGYEILTLKQGSEIILPKYRLYEWSVLPHEIRHGYRSGVAFKEEEPYMIYWTISW